MNEMGNSQGNLVQKDRTVDFLAWLYGSDSLFQSPTGLTYPLIVRTTVSPEPTAVLGNWAEETRSFPQSSWLLEEMQQGNSHLWNGETYAMRYLETAPDGDRLHCTTGSYFDTVNTCTILEVELRRAMVTVAEEASHQMRYEAMPLRRALHGTRQGAAALEDAWSSRERSAAIAISCLFVVNDGQDYRYFVRQRSANLADGAGLYHIVPSMVFQPTAADPLDPKSYSIQNTILREVAEELFDREESDPDLISCPEIADLHSLLVNGDASLRISGIAMDLLCLRPEILAVLVVRDPQWLARHASSVRFSRHEYARVQPDSEGWRSVNDDGVFLPGGEFDPRHCVATGAASAILGLPWVRQPSLHVGEGIDRYSSTKA